MVAFGTGGWRAIIGDEFTKANIQLTGGFWQKRRCSGQRRCLLPKG